MWAATADPAREGQTFKFWPHVLAAKTLARSPFHYIREAENTMLIRSMQGSLRACAGFPWRPGILIWGQFHRVLWQRYKAQSEFQQKVYDADAMLAL